MLLTQEKSQCEKNQASVVSRDKGNQREHRAENPQKKFDLRYYKLDGDLYKQTKCCDFLLVNDSKYKAYLIELKGSNIDDAVSQLEAGEEKCKDELKGYTFLYRLICSKVRTHKIQSSRMKKFKEKCGKRLIIKENKWTDILE